MNSIHISYLYAYLLKSGRPQSLDYAQIITTGLVGDRDFAVIDDGGRMLTAREYPMLLEVEAKIMDDHMYFKCKGDFYHCTTKNRIFKNQNGYLIRSIGGRFRVR